MKNITKVRTRKINSAYVFSENNQVYLKYNTCSQSRNNNTVQSTEWIPISFWWKP